MRLQVHILLPFVPPSEAKKLHVLFNMCERPLLLYFAIDTSRATTHALSQFSVTTFHAGTTRKSARVRAKCSLSAGATLSIIVSTE
jgi:hypothetical protein